MQEGLSLSILFLRLCMVEAGHQPGTTACHYTTLGIPMPMGRCRVLEFQIEMRTERKGVMELSQSNGLKTS